MKTKSVPFSWIQRWGLRLDTAPYMGGAVEARFKLDAIKQRKDQLHEVTQGGIAGIVNAGRIKRLWVEDPHFGTRFLSSTDILRADLSNCALISNKAVASNPNLIIHEGWTLITRAGTVGRMAYARPDMEGMACTEDVLRVIPDTQKIRAGYLYAFLCSKFGVPLVTSGTYGAIIQHIEPGHIADLPVPRLGDSVERKAHELVEKAAKNRTKAAELRQTSLEEFHASLCLEDMSQAGTPLTFATFRTRSSRLSRLDAAFHSPAGSHATEALAHSKPTERFGNVARVFQTNIFKRPYVDDPTFGYTYFSGAELFTYDPAPRGYLRKKAPGIEDYIVNTDWLLMQDAGQLGGLIGKVMRVSKQQDQSVVSNHLIRIAAGNRIDSAYLFTLLSSPIGYRAIVRNAFGSSIPQLESSHLAQIEIPWPRESTRTKIAGPVMESWDLEDSATDADHEAVAIVEKAIEEAA
jgi:type I restriction enzyme S subunit